VAESKIVYENHFYEYLGKAPAGSSLTINEFLYEQGTVEKELIKYFYVSQGNIDYFVLFINEIKQILNSSDIKEKLKITKLIKKKSLDLVRGTNLTNEAKIVLLYVIYIAGSFSKELMRELVKSIAKIEDNLSLKYWLINDLSRMWFLHPESLYDDFFVEMKKLRYEYAHNLCLRWNPPSYIKKENNNICVITFDFHCSAMVHYIAPILRAMSSKGYKIHIIESFPYFSDSSMGIIKPIMLINEQPEISREKLLQHYPKDAEIHCVKNAMMKNRQQDILDLICEINPLCIFDFTDEFSSISYYYYQDYPTIYFPMKYQGYSSSFFHKYVVRQNNELAEVHPPIKKEQILYLPMFRERVEPLRVFQREEYGLVKEDIVVITVGNRLVYEISNELASDMCDLLRSNPKIKWLIVGCTELQFITNHYEDLIGENVIFINYEDDLPGLYGICDIYLNPERIGGYTSIAWAMQQGLSIVSAENITDAGCIGKDNLFLKDAELVPYIARLSKDIELLCRDKEKYRSLAKKQVKYNCVYVDKLIAETNELVNNFKK
jgi:glycosyltransferase involved in cell wall biosynthesis